jgi:hypothetical protein
MSVDGNVTMQERNVCMDLSKQKVVQFTDASACSSFDCSLVGVSVGSLVGIPVGSSVGR